MKNGLLVILFLLTTVVLNAATYYVATNGSNSNPGTITQPFATWNYAMNKLKAGDILYIRGGTYIGMLGKSGANAYGVNVENVSGTSANHITVSAYNGEVPVLDGSSLNLTTGSNVGIILSNCSYWDFVGLTVTNFTQQSVNAYSCPGWVESDCSHITHTFCTVHECGDGFTLWGTKDYIYYKNCDSYQNCDHMDDAGGEGGLANGFAGGLDNGEHVFYEGCRAWENSDDGWDCFNNSGGSGYIEYINCWAFNNGSYGGVSGDGAGFKLGVTVSSADGGIQRTLENCVSVNNLLFGYDQNDGGYGTLIPISIFNCTSSKNKTGGFNFRNGNVSAIRNCLSFNESPGSFGSNTVDHNSWQNGLTISSSDFASIDESELSRPRKSDGSLPDINFLHPATGSRLIDAGVDVGIAYSGNGPDIGAFEFQTGAPPLSPLYVSSVVENATPFILRMTYDLTLANILPSSSSFSVKVNSVARTVSVVAISGTKVHLTLSSPVINGDVVTVSYTKPSTNPLQTASGGQAATLSTQAVVNNVSPAIPAYVSSAVQNATPATLEITYSLSLAIVVPAAGSFAVKVNSSARTVNTVTISGTKVLLSLATPVIYGDAITVSYTKPATNPLQTSSGAQAATFGNQTVINNVNPGASPVYTSSAIENATPNILEMTYSLSLANIVPAASAFTVTVNSLPRSINTVAISGTRVLLTLASSVVYGDIVTVGYTKSSTNPLQTPSAGLAATISSQPVTNRVSSSAMLGYINSAVGNNSPAVLEINYNLSLANILPSASSFSVRVNADSRTVNSVTISGTSVILALATEVLYGDVVTVSYTKPTTNPLQSTSGLQAATMGAQLVTNKVNPVGPVYVSAAIENMTPGILEITYNETLDLSVPGTSAFIVMVNGVKREVTSVSISGNKVLLTLSSPVAYGDIITVSYIKPASNALKKATGETAVSFSFPQPVTNKLAKISIKKVNITIYPNPAREYINVSMMEPSLDPQILRIFDFAGKLCQESKLNSGTNNKVLINVEPGVYIVQVISGTSIKITQKLIVVS
jgi:uncharacterized repeat protein (TIGR02059 family)